MAFVLSPTRNVWTDSETRDKAVVTSDGVTLYQHGEDPQTLTKAEFDVLRGEEPVVEPDSCTQRKLLGGVCGRDLPCRYHTKD